MGPWPFCPRPSCLTLPFPDVSCPDNGPGFRSDNTGPNRLLYHRLWVFQSGDIVAIVYKIMMVTGQGSLLVNNNMHLGSTISG